MGLLAPLGVLATLWLGVELGAGVHRSRVVRILRWCWPVLVLLVVWQLSRFASNTNDQGGDMTDQIALELFAVAYVVLYGVAALGGRIYRLAVGARVPAASLAVVSAPAAEPAAPVARSGSGVWRVVGIGLGVLLMGLVTLGVVKLVQASNYNNRPYPHSLPASGPDDLTGTDYGPSITGAAAAAGVPILWFGPRAFGEPLTDVSLTDRHGRYFPPSSNVDYDENGAVQVVQSLVLDDGAEDQFLTGPSITLHGATFHFHDGFREGNALGLIHGRRVSVSAVASTRAGWTRALRSLRWACYPARPHCSGW